jgi:hypothetical protein
VKEFAKNRFFPPLQSPDENYVFTLQKAVDNYIWQRTGMTIWGLFPLKICMLIQKLASVLEYQLRMNIDCTGSKSTGKSLLLKYYGICLYGFNFKTTVGLSISIPSLRGVTQKASLLGKEITIHKMGLLGAFSNIHIDEVGENPILIPQLKSFLSESNFSNDKAYGDFITYKRTAHVNLSKNIDKTHVGLYCGAIKKVYDNLEITNSVDKPDWDHKWDLFQPLEKYNNPYLKYAIKNQRIKLEREQKFWIDGMDIALHDRFPFFFFLYDDNNENLNETIKENSRQAVATDMIEIVQKLVTDDLDLFFKDMQNFKIEFTKEMFYMVDTIVKEYHLDVDSRIRGIYYDVIKLSMVLNKRIQPIQQDYDLLRYIIEKTNRQITLTETNDYIIHGPEPEQIDVVTKIEEKNFGVMIESEKDVFSDFSTKS